MDWRSVPALVALRTTVDKLIEELVEPGGSDDYVTCEYVLDVIRTRGLADRHHANQVKNAVQQSPTWVALGAMRPKSDIVIDVMTDEDAEVVCFGCGPIKRTGYSWASTFMGVRLRSGAKCAYNLKCECY
jgi:hypothetical protein